MRLLPLQRYLRTLVGITRNLAWKDATFPFYASFKLTSRCHFGCPFCNVKQNRVADMPTQDIKAIIDNISRSPVLLTSFEGGEPLLREDIGELLAYARKKQSFYLLFTTSVKNPFDYPMADYVRYIDFLHVSIDEGHGNMELFDQLPRITALDTQVSVQTVVTAQTMHALDDKVKRCHEAGAAIVVIPATHMDATEDFFPSIDELEQRVRALKKRYPFTIHTPLGYFSAFKKGKCSSASIIIAPDGRLYYPCHILGTKGPDLRSVDLTQWLTSPEARTFRRQMKACGRNCGWYQYYSIESYTSVFSVMEALSPLLFRFCS